MSNPISIVSWNINSIRARIDLVLRFLQKQSPDILCLQETKVRDDLFPEGPFRQLGYNHQLINGQPMHHGVAILSRIPLQNITMHDWQANGEARHIGGSILDKYRVENVYVPAGGDIADRDENPKFGQKLDFLKRMIDWSKKITQPTILTGDFNIAPLESDVWSHKQLLRVVSHTPIEVEYLDRLQSAHDWVDTGRHFIPEPERLYTWWSYRARDWAKSNRGRRLDHMWISPSLKKQAIRHDVFAECRGWLKPSDHIPIMTEFKL